MLFDSKVDSDQWKPRKTQIDTNTNIKSRTQSFNPYRYNLIKQAMIYLVKEIWWFSQAFVTNQRKSHQIGPIGRGAIGQWLSQWVLTMWILCEYYVKTDQKAADQTLQTKLTI